MTFCPNLQVVFFIEKNVLKIYTLSVDFCGHLKKEFDISVGSNKSSANVTELSYKPLLTKRIAVLIQSISTFLRSLFIKKKRD